MKNLTGKCYIQGKWTQGEGTTFYSIDPGTQNPILKIGASGVKQVHEAVIAAVNGFQSWKKVPFEERAAIIMRFAKEVDTNKSQLADLISKEMGKPLWDSNNEVLALQRKAEISIRAYLERCPNKIQEHQHVAHRPIGPVAVLGPFNFPAHLPHGQIIPALLAGNSCIFKPSELTPVVGEACMQLWQQAGLPDNVLQLVQGAKEVGAALLDAKELRGIYFTGSVATGQAIEAHALHFPHRIVALEMGGNNPLIVSQTKNIEAAIYITIHSAFLTSGQRCSCARRLIVIDKQEAFLEKLITATKALCIGYYTDLPEPYMGPVVSKEAAEKIYGKYRMLPQNKVLLEMKQESAFLTPGIVDVTGCQVNDEEVFGPLLVVKHVKDIHEAIFEANNTNFGLSSGIISDNEEELRIALQEIEAGVINCNAPLTGVSSEVPFGGIKDSGNHRPASYYACDFTAYPVSSVIYTTPELPKNIPPGYGNA